MTAGTRSLQRADALAARQLAAIGDELHEARVSMNASQDHVARRCGISRQRYGRIEAGRGTTLNIVELNRLASTLGLSPAIRLYPAGPSVRDSGQTARLRTFLKSVAAPLRYALEVALPHREGAFEQRAWDAMLFGGGTRTAIELEARLRDVQALLRRISLKRRDDPTEGFILLIGDTRNNRRLLAEFEAFFVDLPRLRPSAVRVALVAGRHPGTGLVLV